MIGDLASTICLEHADTHRLYKFIRSDYSGILRAAPQSKRMRMFQQKKRVRFNTCLYRLFRPLLKLKRFAVGDVAQSNYSQVPFRHQIHVKGNNSPDKTAGTDWRNPTLSGFTWTSPLQTILKPGG